MSNEKNIKPIAYIHTDFKTKFGVPRQSGLANDLEAKIIFEPEYRNQEACRELESFSHIWLIWGFSHAEYDSFSPTVRPPRLGGNTRVGVFASRSPFRPNSLGLSSVRIKSIDHNENLGNVLTVLGADLVDMTPIYDIKPYLPFTDSHPDAVGGYTVDTIKHRLDVVFPEELLCRIPKEKHGAIYDVLSQDPRPSYQNDSERIYGFEFATFDVHFKVDGNMLTVCEVNKINKTDKR